MESIFVELQKVVDDVLPLQGSVFYKHLNAVAERDAAEERLRAWTFVVPGDIDKRDEACATIAECAAIFDRVAEIGSQCRHILEIMHKTGDLLRWEIQELETANVEVGRRLEPNDPSDPRTVQEGTAQLRDLLTTVQQQSGQLLTSQGVAGPVIVKTEGSQQDELPDFFLLHTTPKTKKTLQYIQM